MLSGGSSRSTSETWLAYTVTVHVSLKAKSASGSSVYDCGPPLWVAVCDPLVPHEIEYQLPVAPFDGVVLETDGAFSTSQKRRGLMEFRGAGAAATKSAPLLSVSVQPSAARKAAVAVESVGAGAAPSKKRAPS